MGIYRLIEIAVPEATKSVLERDRIVSRHLIVIAALERHVAVIKEAGVKVME